MLNRIINLEFSYKEKNYLLERKHFDSNIL